MQRRLVEQVAAETATGFKKGEKAHAPNGKTKLATKRISNPRLARYFNRRVWQSTFSRSSGPWLADSARSQLPVCP